MLRNQPALTHPPPPPWVRQVGCIATMNFINSISYLATAPMVPFMVLSFHPGLSREEVGYYSGLLEGTFHVGSFLGALFWGWYSDRYGRKPAMLLGLAGTVVSAIAFGMSPTFGVAMAAKFCWGMLNGNVRDTRGRGRGG
jgi:MFS family permease